MGYIGACRLCISRQFTPDRIGQTTPRQKCCDHHHGHSRPAHCLSLILMSSSPLEPPDGYFRGGQRYGLSRLTSAPVPASTIRTVPPGRSEERRVGKECRERWLRGRVRI